MKNTALDTNLPGTRDSVLFTTVLRNFWCIEGIQAFNDFNEFHDSGSNLLK